MNIGSNDYDFYLFLTPPDQVAAGLPQEIANVVGSIATAVAQLEAAGVKKIVLYTLPDFALTPNAVAEGPDVVALVHQIDLIHNAAIRQLAAAYPNVQLVDLFQLTEAFAADPHSFGFSADLSAELSLVQASPSPAFAPNEVGVFRRRASRPPPPMASSRPFPTPR